ncbi:MAG: helix-turn-helix domain-containing protein, partial [Bacteroidaceae bacterium]|nr:helix-turn-helix domain-containing protein [Bacteroidaceae bacterium]
MSRLISNSLRLEIVRACYYDHLKKTEICKKYGVSNATLYRILNTFASENGLNLSMSTPLKNPSLSDSESEILRLRLRIKELE